MDKVVQEVSFYTGITEAKIRSFIVGGAGYKDYYKKLSIRKKNGGFRTVYVPTPDLKQVQYFIKEKYLSSFPISEFATAYVSGKSIVDNALKHRHSKSFLFIDVHDFFNSINFEKTVEIMEKFNTSRLTNEEIKTILLLCSHDYEFVQGCVTSPLISNIYMYEFDLAISNIVSSLSNGVYTRYSDDITISSSEKIPYEILTKVESELIKLNLTINKQKTHFASNLDNVKITGIRIKRNGAISLNTEFKKTLKNRIYHISKYGSSATENPEELIGLLNYLKMIDSKYYNKINFKYVKNNNLCIEWLKALAKNEGAN